MVAANAVVHHDIDIERPEHWLTQSTLTVLGFQKVPEGL